MSSGVQVSRDGSESLLPFADAGLAHPITTVSACQEKSLLSCYFPVRELLTRNLDA
ncbi:MAG: hypothetical protein QOH70_1936 [Blastocatellia bacterium]|jgi:hypothetical protein|nr:hypothetical protein [Blastocatellia bacterium]